jgi:3'(2'), 5'-bisphosphate nucleotidase
LTPRDPLAEVVAIARAAGEHVMEVYSGECAVQTKADGSPVTAADHRAQEVICAGLARLDSETPVVDEEDCRLTSDEVRAFGRFWLVDPLDGTKEFLNRNGEFTINIGLIEDERPVLGVVFAPALGRLFAGAPGSGAVVEDAEGRRGLSARTAPAEGITVVSSRSHGDPDALSRCLAGHKVAASICAGSSLKFCLVAAGEADIYPRFGRTMEWDTAAGDAILRAAGGTVTDLEGRALTYGKPGFANPHFVAQGREPALIAAR